MLAQSFLQAVENEKFSLSSTPMLDDSCMLEINGSFTGNSDRGNPQLSITLMASKLGRVQQRTGPRGMNKTLCSLETRIEAPLGHPVVLCVSPVDLLTSVFVIQILN